MKMIRFPNIVVFDPGEICVACLEDSLLIAERGKSIRCFHCGNEFVDPLCWLCEDGVSRELLRIGNQPICLKGHKHGWVRFCRDFTAGPGFGTNWKKDKGKRRKKVEKAFSTLIFKNCSLCKYWNTDKVKGMLETLKPEEKSEYKHTWLVMREVIQAGIPFTSTKVYFDAAFCELGEEAVRKDVICSSFKLAQESKRFYEYSKKILPKYVETLKFLELLYPS